MLNFKFGDMKKVGLYLIALAMVILSCSCNLNKNCPAYADNTVEVEQNV